MDRKHLLSEEAKIRTLRRIVDDCAKKLAEDDVGEAEAVAIIESVRKKVLGLFPGKEDQFELIYRTRFQRILKEKHLPEIFKNSPK